MMVRRSSSVRTVTSRRSRPEVPPVTAADDDDEEEERAAEATSELGSDDPSAAAAPRAPAVEEVERRPRRSSISKRSRSASCLGWVFESHSRTEEGESSSTPPVIESPLADLSRASAIVAVSLCKQARHGPRHMARPKKRRPEAALVMSSFSFHVSHLFPNSSPHLLQFVVASCYVALEAYPPT